MIVSFKNHFDQSMNSLRTHVETYISNEMKYITDVELILHDYKRYEKDITQNIENL